MSAAEEQKMKNVESLNPDDLRLVMRLNGEDFEKVVRAIENPPEPNERLKRLMQDHHERVGS